MEFIKLAKVFQELEATSSKLKQADILAGLFKKTRKTEARHLAYLCQGIIAPEHSGLEIGMAEKLAQQSLHIVSGKPLKEIQHSFRKTGDLGETAQQFLEKKSQRALGTQKLSTEKVYDNLYRIATASGTGSQQQKIRLLAELLSSASPLEGRYITRFVLDKMRLGVGEATILDGLSVHAKGDKSLRPDLERAFNMTSDLGLITETFFAKGLPAVKRIKPLPFNPIRPALAERLTSPKQILDKIGPCLVEGKYDGFRLQVHKQGKRVELYSRRQERVTHMFPDVVEAAQKQVKAREAILEGEAIAFNASTHQFLPFQETIQRKRKHGVKRKTKELPLKLFVFELLYADGKDYTNEPFQKRRKALEKTIRAKPGKTIELSEAVPSKNPKQLQAFFKECVSAGLEGVIAKDLNAPYVAGARKFAWIKLKKSYTEKLGDTLDVVVVGYYYGKGKRTQFGFGGLLAAVRAGDKYKTVTKIGTGFSEEQMKWFSDTLSKDVVKEKPGNVESLLEPHAWVKPRLVVEVRADEITRSPTHTCAMSKGEGLALRFPRLVKVRSDRRPGDATTEKEVRELFELQKNR